MSARRHLGRGWAFPIRVGPRGGLEWSEGDKSVQESLFLLLGTAPGERIHRPELGCGIHDLVFAPNNPATRAEIQRRIRRSILRYEPRIDLGRVDVTPDPERPEVLLIRIDYRIRGHNARGNVVYPFFLREGEGA
ncbi:MAG: GPW/gp25 family protein [Sandaracinaceae bacterium]|nr:GPW/gp25 family protein [Sandaracinaceae bacterium]